MAETLPHVSHSCQAVAAGAGILTCGNRVLLLVVQVVPPVKTADFKLTVSTNREAVQMAELFADMLMQVWCVVGCCRPPTPYGERSRGAV